MSNKLRGIANKPRKPNVKQDQFLAQISLLKQQLTQSQQQIQQLSIQFNGCRENHVHLIKYLMGTGIIQEEDYSKYIQQLNEEAKKNESKMKLAREIAQDKSLDKEAKLKKAEDAGIPVEWFHFPEPEKKETLEKAVQEKKVTAKRKSNTKNI